MADRPPRCPKARSASSRSRISTARSRCRGAKRFALDEDEYLLNGNYKGTYRYLAEALRRSPTLTIAGVALAAGADTPLQETYYMNQIGNNDRGTLIVPDAVAERLTKAVKL